MKTFIIVLLALFKLCVTQQYSNKSDGCGQLSTKYPRQTFLPNTANYTFEYQHFWSKTEVLAPYCVFLPEVSQDIANALTVLRSTNTKFNVRGGGHMPIKGAAGLDDGVLIALTNLNTINLTPDKSVLRLGPGWTWGQVYDWLSPSNLVVVGGRYFSVGVPGLLLGGGLSYLSQQYGWAMDNVINYEVVTADSKIIEANATSHPDLFWALKGGSNNFGIVTRFDLKTYPSSGIYGGTLSYDAQYTADVWEATTDFVVPGGGSDDPKAAVQAAFFSNPAAGGTISATHYVFHDGNEAAPPALAEFTKIPSNSTVKLRTYANMATETAIYADESERESFYSTAMVASRSAMQLINQTFVDSIAAALPQLKNVKSAQVVINPQPITEALQRQARAHTGDALDLDPADGSFLAINVISFWSDAVDDDYMHSLSNTIINNLVQNSKAAGVYYPFIYMNDAGAGQDPYQFYGKGKNLAKLRQIRARYDPQGIFQTLEAGAFKIGL